MKNLKVAIIGAGITGLYLAWKLSEKGHKVTIFEKKEKIGKETCSGIFSERILKFIPQSKKLIQNKIELTLIHFPKKILRLRFSREFFLMSHFDLDNLVAGLAKKAGAETILNHNMTRSDLITLQENFDRIIGCDGYNSVVRKELNLPNPVFRLALLGVLSKKDSSKYVETWAHQSNGFVWKIPRGKETEYGIIGESTKTRKLFEKFLKRNNLPLEKINSALVPQGLVLPHNSKITLCGDAAGLTKPWSGGGVIWGLTAANLLLKNFPDFLKYKKEMKKFFLPKIVFSKIVTKMVYFLGFNFPWLLPKEFKIESDFLL